MWGKSWIIGTALAVEALASVPTCQVRIFHDADPLALPKVLSFESAQSGRDCRLFSKRILRIQIAQSGNAGIRALWIFGSKSGYTYIEDEQLSRGDTVLMALKESLYAIKSIELDLIEGSKSDILGKIRHSLELGFASSSENEIVAGWSKQQALKALDALVETPVIAPNDLQQIRRVLAGLYLSISLKKSG